MGFNSKFKGLNEEADLVFWQLISKEPGQPSQKPKKDLRNKMG